MPVSLCVIGEEYIVKRISGSVSEREQLSLLGVTAGAVVCVVSEIGGSIILNVGDSRIAISRELAEKIIV